MKEKVLAVVEGNNLIKEQDNIVVGVSGGPDSMALLYVLLEIRDTIDFNIHIVHINHGVRGEDAKQDQLFVERIAKELRLPYHTKDVDMIGYGKEKGISSEEAGRELRYGFFREIIGNLGGGKIAVAHNMNDQAETLVMRFFRGTGIDGLKGMGFVAGDIIRPLLGIRREEIEEYIGKNAIETVLDKTNLESIYTRNKIRLEMIPYIEKNFNPNIVNTLWRMSRISSEDSRFLENFSNERYRDVVTIESEVKIVLDGKKLLKEDRSIQQRIIRISLLKINKSLQGFSEIQISSVLNLLSSMETGKEVHLSNGLRACINYGDLVIERTVKDNEVKYLYPLNMLGQNMIRDIGYNFHMEILKKDDDFIMNKGNNIKYFDLDKIKGSLCVRNRENGDRFNPFGMKGTKKLKDYFIDEKIPREARDRIPIIADEENILWVVGYRINELYKVTKETKRVLVIHKEENNGKAN